MRIRNLVRRFLEDSLCLIGLCLGIFLFGFIQNGSAQTQTDSLWSFETILMDTNADDTLDYLGEEVRVSGIANTSSGIFHETYLQSFLQNNEYGISIFNKVMVGSAFNRGDSLVVNGVMQNYHGLDEIRVLSYEVYPDGSRELSPKSISAAIANTERFIGMLVEGKGTITEKGTIHNGKYLRVSPSDTASVSTRIYVSNFHKHFKEFDFEVLSVGDEISFKGIMAEYNPDFPEQRSYQVQLRTPDDLEYAGLPRFYWHLVIGGILLLALIVMGWVIMLRRRVDQKTKQIQAALDEKDKLLEEKEILVKEIHHRVKNNLSIISGLIGLQLDTTNDQTAREVLRDSQARIQSMATIHDKLYQNESLAEISLDSYLQELVKAIHSTFDYIKKSVDLTFNMQPVNIDIDKVVPCGLLVNELVVNAFKHAFESGKSGELKVSLKDQNGYLELGIADNGPGLPDDFGLGNGGSLGSMLINTFASQLEAKTEINSSDSGTTFKITFPKN